MKKIIQLNTELYKVTGIQRVLMDIHNALSQDFQCKIAGFNPFNKVNPNLKIMAKEYFQFRNPLSLRNSIVIIHERRLLPLMWLLSHIPFFNLEYIYIHHNELYGKKSFSFFPKHIVAISDAGIKNLTEYFKIPKVNITKIHNCVSENPKDIMEQHKIFNPKEIKILYPARINNVKRQIEIVSHLKNSLNPNITILFAGEGPKYEELKDLCKDSPQFEVLGFRKDIDSLLGKVDFVMLYSIQEGLPIALIEGAKFGKPLICNNVGGNYEIAQKNKNLVEVTTWENLADTINSLSLLSEEEYYSMCRKSREIYMENFREDIFRKKYVSLINSIENE